MIASDSIMPNLPNIIINGQEEPIIIMKDMTQLLFFIFVFIIKNIEY